MPSGRGANTLYRLRPYQVRALRAILDTPGAQEAIISAPRGWGKTGLLAPLLVWALYERDGAQVVLGATGMRTARQAYDRAVRIIERSPELAAWAVIYYNAANPYVEIPSRGATMFPLPAEERHIVGMSPSLVLIDEAGYVDTATWTALRTSLGKIDGSILVGIGTPGLGTVDAKGPNIMWTRRTQALSASPPKGLVWLEFSAPPGADPAKPATWRKANPAVGDLLDPAAVAYDLVTLSAERFAQFRLGLWTQSEGAWISAAVWDALPVEHGPPPDGSTIGLGFDGSASGDATALAYWYPAGGRSGLLGMWERPGNAPRWEVPRSEVVELVDDAFRRYNVVALYADPWYWRQEIQDWAGAYGEERVIVYNTAQAARMGPATDAYLALVLQGLLVWDGSPRLRAHILSAVAHLTAAGSTLRKDARQPSLIDAAIAAVLAHEAVRLTEEAPVPVIY